MLFFVNDYIKQRNCQVFSSTGCKILILVSIPWLLLQICFSIETTQWLYHISNLKKENGLYGCFQWTIESTVLGMRYEKKWGDSSVYHSWNEKWKEIRWQGGALEFCVIFIYFIKNWEHLNCWNGSSGL